MAGLSGPVRIGVWALAVLSFAVMVGLAILVFTVDLDSADKAASVIGAVVGLLSLVVSVIALASTSSAAPPASSAGRRVRARGRRAMAAGGSIQGNAFGNFSSVTPASAPAPPVQQPGQPEEQDVRARGKGALAAGGDISGNAFGDGSQAR